MHTATLRLNDASAETLLRSISPEAGREIPRSRVHGQMEDGQLVLRVEADDLAALRAALNSYIRWMIVAQDMSKMAGGQNG
jgi:KEOPS complex subunit Pcc1